jgi:hypothetical protein
VKPLPGTSLPIPAATHVQIYQSLIEHYDLGHPTFAAGRLGNRGWWWYFPLAFAIKTPLTLLLLLGVSIGYVMLRLVKSRPQPSSLVRYAALGLFPVLYGGASLFSSVNIGYRHLLPVLPFLVIGVSIAINMYRERLRRSGSPSVSLLAMGGLVALLLGQAVMALRLQPQPLTYFNALAGGPENGYRYLVDSNLDWGQNLWDLKSWMESNQESHVHYAHYSPARPQAYGINATYLPPDPKADPFVPWAPDPGLYAIGATVLQGPYAPSVNTFGWFRAHTPVARLGHALFLFQVPTQDSPAWIVQCYDTIPGEVLQRNLALDPAARLIHVDCQNVQVYPNETDAGYHLLPAESTIPSTATVEVDIRHPSGASLAKIVKSSVKPRPSNKPELGRDVLAGPLTFLGYDLDETSANATDRDQACPIVLTTYWQVQNIPDRPLSLIAHLLDASGHPVAIGDAMDYPLDQWKVGDLLVQKHRLEPVSSVPHDTTLTLVTGGYWLDTMERWSVGDQGQDRMDALVLQKLELK